MTPSQLIAWLVCLVLAFFAAALAVSNSYKVAIVERRFEAVRHSAQDQTEVLARIEGVLGKIEDHLSEDGAPRPAAAAHASGTTTPPPAP
jgi:hypothetical protein